MKVDWRVYLTIRNKIFSYVDCVNFWFITSELASQYPRTSMALLNLLIVASWFLIREKQTLFVSNNRHECWFVINKSFMIHFSSPQIER